MRMRARMRWARWAAVGVGLLIVGAACVGTVLPGNCYDDIRVSGAGSTQVNGTYAFEGTYNGHPRWCTSGSCNASIEFNGLKWTIVYGGQDMYYGCSCSMPKPTNWTVGPGGTLPTPRVDGGQACKTIPLITVVPAGEAGILDRGWPEGETPPIVGERVVSAVYAIGEPITGCVRLLGPEDQPVTNEHVELILSRVESIGQDYDKTQYLDVQTIGYTSARAGYSFSLPTDTPLNAGTGSQHVWSPGYYDLRLNYPDGSIDRLRIQLVEPPPPEA